MSVVDHDFSDVADGVVVDEIVGGAIAAVPGRFVVYEDLDFSTLSGGLHSSGIFVAHGKRLLHHYRNAMAGAGFDYTAMIECIRIDEHRLRLGLLDHLVDAGEEDVVWQGEFR